MDLKIKIGSRELACEWLEKRQQIVRGVLRPVIEITLPDGEIKLDALRNLLADTKNTQTITVKDLGTGGQHELVGYTMLTDNGLAVKTMQVTEATYDTPATYETKIVVQLAIKFAWEGE